MNEWDQWARRPGSPEPTRTPPDPEARRRAQRLVVALILAFAVGVVGYRAIMGAGLDQTAALFVGLPALLAIAVATSRPARTVTGLILKVMTVALLLSGILLGETMICLVVAAPLVWLVGVAVGVPIDMSRRRRARGRGQGPLAVVGLVLLASLEGAVPGLHFPTAGAVEAVRVLDASPAQVEAALAATPRFDTPMPTLLRIGFPRPVDARGEGLDVGDRRRVRFVGDDHHGRTHVGDLVLEVSESAPGRVVFTLVSDHTRVAQWLRWSRAEVEWTPMGGRTRVRWRLEYERRLAPFWYFRPVQHVTAHAAAGWLIDTVATPRD